MSVPVVALDLAKETGFAIYGGSVLTSSGSFLIGKRSGNAWSRVQAAVRAFEEVLEPVAWGRGEVVYESVVTIRYRNAIRSACHLEACLWLACKARGVNEANVTDYKAKAVKKSQTGNGNASKALVIEAMSKRWGKALTNDNEADALALLAHHLEATF